eukprot:7227768-Pyramimonas_sp.AAC.1
MVFTMRRRRQHRSSAYRDFAFGSCTRRSLPCTPSTAPPVPLASPALGRLRPRLPAPCLLNQRYAQPA